MANPFIYLAAIIPSPKSQIFSIALRKFQQWEGDNLLDSIYKNSQLPIKLIARNINQLPINSSVLKFTYVSSQK